MPGLMQAWPTVAACWSPAMPEHRHRRAEDVGGGDAELARAIDDLGQQRRRHAEQLQQICVPGAFVDVEQQGAAGIGGVARMHLAAGQAPQQEAFDGAGRQRALLRRGPAAGDVVEDPGDLGAGEIGIEQQAGLRRDLVLVAGALQLLAAVGGAAVLPDDGVVDRLAGAAVPHHRGLALVGDADAGQRLGVELGLGQRAAADLDRGRPDLLGVVLDPAGLRKDLRQLLLRAAPPAGRWRRTRWRGCWWCPGRWRGCAWRPSCVLSRFCGARSVRAVDGEVDGLEQGGLERLVGKEPQRIARHGAVVAGALQRIGEAPWRSSSTLACSRSPSRWSSFSMVRFQNSRSTVRPRRKARITGRVILPSRKSSPTVLPSSASRPA